MQIASKCRSRILIIFLFILTLSAKENRRSSRILRNTNKLNPAECDIVHIVHFVGDITSNCYFRLTYAPHVSRIEAAQLLYLWLGGAFFMVLFSD